MAESGRESDGPQDAEASTISQVVVMRVWRVQGDGERAATVMSEMTEMSLLRLDMRVRRDATSPISSSPSRSCLVTLSICNKKNMDQYPLNMKCHGSVSTHREL